MPKGVSVVICCYNSASRIEPTLLHLANQKGILTTQWEVIVVDNNSTDNLSEIVTNIWNNFNGKIPALKIFFEPRQGLSLARQKGIEASKFDYIIFCDDDNWLHENYVRTALKIMQTSPFIGALGGEGYPVFEKKEPPYFWVNQYHTLAVGPQWMEEGDITNTRGVLYGAGLVLNKAAYQTLIQKFQFQFLITDRLGKSLISSGDHELCFALKRIGYKIYFTKQLKFSHFIPEARTKITYYKKLFLEFGKSFALLQPYRIGNSKMITFKNDYRYICLRSLKNIIAVSFKLAFNGYYSGRNDYKNLDYLHQLYNNIGIFKSSMRIKNSFKVQMSSHPIFYADKLK